MNFALYREKWKTYLQELHILDVFDLILVSYVTVLFYTVKIVQNRHPESHLNISILTNTQHII